MSTRMSFVTRIALLLLATCAFAPLARADDADAALIARGQYLATAGDCVACHSAPKGLPFAGGLPLDTPLGKIVSTNITPSKRFGIGNYTLDQFSAALREGVRSDGAHLYPAMPYTSYAQVSDDDVKALYAYFMHGVKPVEVASKETALPFPFNIRLSMMGWNLLFLDRKPFVPDPAKSVEWNRGAYLVNGLAHCSTCHTPRNLLMAEKPSLGLSGGAVGTWYAPNVTSDRTSGIGGWSETEIADYLRSGHVVGKAQAAGPMAEAVDNSFRHLNDTDLKAMAVYLKTTPPVGNSADTTPAYGYGRPTGGFAQIRGEPVPTDANTWSGPQLYDAYCASCHQARGQGAGEGIDGPGLPSLFHNTALGHTNTDNLVMVMLDGVHRQADVSDVLMPAFGRLLSDEQIATLGNYLLATYGNPRATVTSHQVATLRAGGAPSMLVPLARTGMVLAVIVVLALAWWFIRKRRDARSRVRPTSA